MPGILIPTGNADLVDDAADALRRCAHAFADHQMSIIRAQRHLDNWSGEAKIVCERRCQTVASQLDCFREGSTDAGTALRKYAAALRHHQLAIKRNVEEAESAVGQIATAKKAAAASRAAAKEADDKATSAAALPHGAHKVQELQTEAAHHNDLGGSHDRAAASAAADLEAIRRRAQAHLDAIHEAANAANKTLLGLSVGLPEVQPQNVDGPADLVVATTTTILGGSAKFVIFKLGADHTIVQETKAGGETKVTILNKLAAGLDLSFGGKLNVGKTRGDDAAAGMSAEVMVQIMAALTGGKSRKFKTEKEALNFIEHHPLGNGDAGYDIEDYREASVTTSASAKAGGPAAGVSSAAEAEAAVAVTINRATGEITTMYRVMADSSAGVEALTMGASAGSGGTSEVSVTRDRHGNITKLVISSGTTTHGSVDLKSAVDLREVASRVKEVKVGGSPESKHLVRTEVQLNVDEHNRNIVEDYLRTLGHGKHVTSDLESELNRDGMKIVTESSSHKDGISAGFRVPFLEVEGHESTEHQQVQSASIAFPGDNEFHKLRLGQP